MSAELFGQINLFSLVRSKERHIEEIGRDEAKPFIESIHYSRIYPNNIVKAYGLFEDSELIGVCTYGIPASPSLCIGIAGRENKDKVLELNRLAIKPNYGGGTGRVTL